MTINQFDATLNASLRLTASDDAVGTHPHPTKMYYYQLSEQGTGIAHEGSSQYHFSPGQWAMRIGLWVWDPDQGGVTSNFESEDVSDWPATRPGGDNRYVVTIDGNEYPLATNAEPQVMRFGYRIAIRYPTAGGAPGINQYPHLWIGSPEPANQTKWIHTEGVMETPDLDTLSEEDVHYRIDDNGQLILETNAQYSTMNDYYHGASLPDVGYSNGLPFFYTSRGFSTRSTYLGADGYEPKISTVGIGHSDSDSVNFDLRTHLENSGTVYADTGAFSTYYYAVGTSALGLRNQFNHIQRDVSIGDRRDLFDTFENIRHGYTTQIQVQLRFSPFNLDQLTEEEVGTTLPLDTSNPNVDDDEDLPWILYYVNAGLGTHDRDTYVTRQRVPYGIRRMLE